MMICIYTVSQKNDTKLFPYPLQMLIDFQNSFADRRSGKSAKKLIFKYSTTP